MLAIFDVTILEWITANLHGTFLVPLFYAITVLGDLGLIWLAYAGYLRFKEKRAKEAFLILIALLLTSFLTDVIIKNIIARPRPFETYTTIIPALIRPHSFSFPSGHSATSFACAMMIGLMDPSRRLPAFVIATLIAISRMVLCVHYPSDIIAGALLGCLVSYLIFKLVQRRGKC